jgi:hypothetical protein
MKLGASTEKIITTVERELATQSSKKKVRLRRYACVRDLQQKNDGAHRLGMAAD